MKKIVNLLLVLFPVLAIGQTQTKNYIKTVAYKVATPTVITSPTILQANQNITYFDGLGRPIQEIASQQSTTGKDIITPINYDNFGRQIKEYLPFRSSTSNMSFDINAEANVLSYYSSATTSPEVTTSPFSEKELERSPLNRIVKQAAPGDDWKLSSGHEIKYSYQANTTQEVRLFFANTTWNSVSKIYDITLDTGLGFYAANQLFKNIVYNENTTAVPSETNGSTVEFKNKSGQVVLKRTYDASAKHDTYYVYDIYGNLIYVIPPKGTDVITTAQANVSQILNDLCYQYKYDNRNRMVEKKLPGKQWEFIVYDNLNRAVASGPTFSPFTNLTSVGWLITKYDALSRPILTGWLPATITTTTRKTLQETQDAVTVNFSETKIATATNTLVPPTTGVAFRYTNVTWPTTGYHVLTVNYYDDYNFPGAPTIPINVTDGDQPVYYDLTRKPIGLSTGKWIRLLQTSTTYLNEQAYNLYDAKARLIRTYTKNYLGGYSYTDNKLDAFSGQLKYSISKHKRLLGSSELKTENTFTYSAQDRLLTQTHRVNKENTELISSNSYNELGQLISKRVGNALTASIQSVNYSYNIRGWLTGINDVNTLTKIFDPKDLFAYKINYNKSDTSGVTPLYNGNIAETYWLTASETTPLIRGYGYTYDKLNRLKTSIFKRDGVVNNAYNENLSYDKNGNIMSISRFGNSDTSPVQIDNLVYSYSNSNASNQLMKVVDNAPAANKINGFTDSAANSIDDYSYDTNGNLTKDNNKDITSIVYNHLNLPTKVTFATAGDISYTYNAEGKKILKIVNATGLPSVTTSYLDGYQYKGGTLEFFPTAEGYVQPSGSSFKYVYQYKDHLGNVRLSYRANMTPFTSADIFEDGFESQSGWAANTTWNTGTVLYDNNYVKSGAYMGKIVNPGPGEVYCHNDYWMPINNSQSTSYTYSAWVYSSGPSIQLFLLMKTDAETGYATQTDNVLTTVIGEWIKIEKTVSVPANIRSINIRLDNNSTGVVWFDDVQIRKVPAIIDREIIEEDNYYPFGMKHGGYNTTSLSTNLGQKIKYQGQERQDELDLNWDSFKYRNYDYAIGRFMSVDPLAEKYAYNGVYNFQENKMGLGTELEGLELEMHVWLNIDAVVNPNGVGAHAIGFGGGVIDGMRSLWNAISHPVDTAKGLGNFMLGGIAAGSMNIQTNAMQVDNMLGTNSYAAVSGFSQLLDEGFRNLLQGNGLERGHVFGTAAFNIATAEAGGAMWRATSRGLTTMSEGFAVEMPAFTKSNLSLGRQMHSEYMLGKEGVLKEFRLPSGKRIDALDIPNSTINELKPFNPRAIKAGERQLQNYKNELQNMPQFKGVDWKTNLDLY